VGSQNSVQNRLVFQCVCSRAAIFQCQCESRVIQKILGAPGHRGVARPSSGATTVTCVRRKSFCLRRARLSDKRSAKHSRAHAITILDMHFRARLDLSAPNSE
jgi:hypothetical protein